MSRAACNMCGDRTAFIEVRKACPWYASMPEWRTRQDVSDLNRRALCSSMSPHFGSGILYLGGPPGAARRTHFKCCGFASAGLASFMEAYRLVSYFGIKTLILQDLLLSYSSGGRHLVNPKSMVAWKSFRSTPQPGSSPISSFSNLFFRTSDQIDT